MLWRYLLVAIFALLVGASQAHAFLLKATGSAPQATASTCPLGTSYVSSGDGCASAQATSTTQVGNFFQGYTGQAYAATGSCTVTVSGSGPSAGGPNCRPPWNVAGVDYPVGYAGTLVSPVGNLPSCASISGQTVSVNADTQPCVIQGIDFSTGTGYCVNITGSASPGNTVTIKNSNFGTGSTNCTGATTGFETINGTANALNEYDTFYVNRNIYQNVVVPNGSGTITVEYSYFYELVGRFVGSSTSSSGTYVSQYNFMYSLCGTPCAVHAEIEYFQVGSNPWTATEQFNTYYETSGDSANSGMIYPVQGNGGPTPGFTTFNVNYNTLVSRQSGVSGELIYPGGNSPGTSFGALNVNYNYTDDTGTYGWFVIEGGGPLTSYTCAHNMNMLTGSADTYSGGSPSMTCD